MPRSLEPRFIVYAQDQSAAPLPYQTPPVNARESLHTWSFLAIEPLSILLPVSNDVFGCDVSSPLLPSLVANEPGGNCFARPGQGMRTALEYGPDSGEDYLAHSDIGFVVGEMCFF